MNVHRRFNFDNPEDSYWNETRDNTFVSETQNSQYVRRELDDLFPSTESNVSRSFFDDNPEDLVNEAGVSVVTTGDISKNTSSAFEPHPNTSASLASGSDRWTTVSCNDRHSISDKSSVHESSKTSDGLNEVERRLATLGSSSIISDHSLGSQSSELTIHLDYARLKSEHRKLQRHFENQRKERFRALPIEATIKRMCKCEPVSLDLYKSKAEKLELLNAALESIDHDVISTVIMFLKRTLTNPIFREILITVPDAAKHYVLFLRESGECNELIDTLFALGRSEEAAMVEFSEAVRKQHPEFKIQALNKCLISGFSVPTLSDEAAHVRDYIASLTQINRNQHPPVS